MPHTAPPSPQRLDAARTALHQLEAAVNGAVLGQRRVVREVVVALAAAGHVLLEGLPGMGKTLLVRALAQALGGRFSRIQFTPDLMPSDITGHAIFDMKSERFHIRRGPIFCNLLLGDEINRAPAKTQAAMLEAMQEQQVTIEGESIALAPPFLVLATQNPIEQEGTYPLPLAQLDRFLVKSSIDYPASADELEIVRSVTAGAVGDALDVSAVTAVMSPQTVLAVQATAATLTLDHAVLDYALRLVRATRDWQGLDAGAGTRAAIALVRAARGHALLDGGGDFVTPGDVKAMAPAVLRHRVRLGAELEIEGYRADDVLVELLASVEAPRA
jgi:MoxR-like ATPase